MPMPSSKVVILVKRFPYMYICVYMYIFMNSYFPRHDLQTWNWHCNVDFWSGPSRVLEKSSSIGVLHSNNIWDHTSTAAYFYALMTTLWCCMMSPSPDIPLSHILLTLRNCNGRFIPYYLAILQTV